MTASTLTLLADSGNWLTKTINYEVIKGNAIWRFVLVLLVLVVAMAVGKIVQFAINNYAERTEKNAASPS